MSTRHTPGPWATEIADYGSKRIGTVFGGSQDIARIVVVGDGLTRETDANARLIAAAPDLLRACQQAIVALKGREHDGFLRDAIAKATGASA